MEYMTMHEILDHINHLCGFIGLNNDNKKTDDRDDVISRQAWNNWKAEYNRGVKSGEIDGTEVQTHVIDQYVSKYKKSDVDTIIAHFETRLGKPFTDKTLEVRINNKLRTISKRLYNATAIELYENGDLDDTIEKFKTLFDSEG